MSEQRFHVDAAAIPWPAAAWTSFDILQCYMTLDPDPHRACSVARRRTPCGRTGDSKDPIEYSILSAAGAHHGIDEATWTDLLQRHPSHVAARRGTFALDSCDPYGRPRELLVTVVQSLEEGAPLVAFAKWEPAAADEPPPPLPSWVGANVTGRPEYSLRHYAPPLPLPQTHARFHVASDLHAELGKVDVESWPWALDTDLLLAGDVGRVSDRSWLTAVARIAAKYRHVWIVLGNHDVYNAARHTPADIDAHAAEQTKQLRNVTLLQRGAAVTPEGVTILGCTLWSDVSGHEADVGAMLLDYRAIWVADAGSKYGGKRRMTPSDSTAWWRRDVEWLREALRDAKKPTIVLTHHGPHTRLNPPAYADSPVTAAFVSDLPFALPPDRVVAAVSGHTHGRLCVATDEGVPLVAHCLGYRGELAGPYAPRLLTVDLATGAVTLGPPAPLPKAAEAGAGAEVKAKAKAEAGAGAGAGAGAAAKEESGRADVG